MRSVRIRKPRLVPSLAILLLGLTARTPSIAQLADPRQSAPEAASGTLVKPSAIATHHMIVTANALATDAGLAILRGGGSAVDAAIAAQMVLNLVEPQSSGLGGGAFLLSWDAKSQAIETIDGRETAPLLARSDRFLKPDGTPRSFDDILVSPLSVGVPGVVRALELAHRHHGKLTWAKLFEPAIALSENGFEVSPRLHALLEAQGAAYFNAQARALYFDDAGTARPVGYRLTNPELATALRTIASNGPDAFYNGPVAEGILRSLNSTPGATNDLTMDDLSHYEAKLRNPICTPFRGYRVCGMGPPSSGGTTIGMSLGMLEAATNSADAANPTPPNRDTTHILRDHAVEIATLTEAEKLAYADRDTYIADPDFVPQSADLLDKTYLASRAKLIDPEHPIPKARPGSPPRKTGALFGIDATYEQPGTSHVSIVDDDGNAVAMTTSIQTAFGSGLMASGFLLNSELTDFSFKPADGAGTPIANRVEGGKRPRSSMAPTLIFDAKGDLFAILGSPGGSRIILYNLKAIVCLIDWPCSPAQAAGLPNFGSLNGPFEAEAGTAAQVDLAPAFAARGSLVTSPDMTSGLAIIERHDGILEGAADPRREGSARGD